MHTSKSGAGRRIRAIAVISVAVAVLAAGCTGNTDSKNSSKKVTLTVWADPSIIEAVKDDPAGRGRYAKLIETEFEKAHPNVDVKLENHGWDDVLRQNLLTAVLGGVTPDVVVGESFFQSFAALGALAPIDDVIGKFKDNLVAGTIKPGQFGGKTYAIPAFTGVFGFERNCDVIAKAGLNCDKPPATWDELLSDVKAVSAKGAGKQFGMTLQGPIGSGLGSVFRTAVYLEQSGASLCKNNCTAPNFNDPKSVKTYEFMRELNKSTMPGLTFEPDEARIYTQLFKNKVAYQTAGSWSPKWALENGCKSCRYSAVPIPQGGTAASIIVGNPLYAVLAKSKNKDLAKAFVASLASDKAQIAAWKYLGRDPATRSALNSVRGSAPASDQKFMDILLNGAPQALPQWPKNAQKVWQIWNDMFAKILTTNDPIQPILDEAQKLAETEAKA